MVSTTMASVILVLGNDKAPVTAKLVVVAFPNRPLVEVIMVPEALTKLRAKIVPTVVRFGNEVEAAMVKKVDEARAG